MALLIAGLAIFLLLIFIRLFDHANPGQRYQGARGRRAPIWGFIVSSPL